MLDELSVANLGLIAEAHLEPGPGLVVVTGETGTGKTLLLGALRLLRGEPARRDLVGPHGDETLVQARIVVDGEETTVARRVGGDRSRAYLDGAMVPARALEERLGSIVEIVAQHDHLRLAEPTGVRALVDACLDEAGQEAVVAYRAAWEEAASLEARAALLGGDRRSLERELDVVRFQAEEIAAAGFAPGDDERLEAEANRRRHAETLAEELAAAVRAAGEDGAGPHLETAARALRRAARLDPSLAALADQLEEAATLVAEAVAETAKVAGDLEHDPTTLAEVEERLAVLGDLRRKYGDTLADVLAFAEAARIRAEELTGLLGDADRLDALLAEARARLEVAGDGLREAREAAARRLVGAAVAHLEELGFREPVVDVLVERAAAGPHGADRIRLLFASERALEPRPVGRVASGGELSRLVLALRLAAAAGDVPVLAFDEVDAGVGGAVALALGEKLASLAAGRQVLCVTHLPQVAAFADRHLVVAREGPTATVRAVVGEERLAELTRMLSGLPDSLRGRDHAAELLSRAART